jgi:beta-glucosidase/6-phospho-beta-glucosidase/beta-galactosidase
VQLLANDGVPLVGFTWYSLTDQIDWSIAMSEAIGLVYPVGLFDLNREPRAVGLSYKHLIDLYRDQPQYRECKPLKEIMD